MTAKQVGFYDDENQEYHSGILVNNDYIICGCCGGIFEVSELDADKISIYDDWTNIEDTICEGSCF